MSDPTTVTIGSRDYDVYADPDYVDGYADGAVGAGADAWRAITTPDVRERLTVSATRLVDRQSWAGERTDDAQNLAFPRSGLLDADGNEIDDDDGLWQSFLDGFCELVMALAESTDVQTLATTESNVASLTAGSVSITFWRGVSSSVAARFPQTVNEIFGRWLAGSTGVVGSTATGTNGCSDFDDDWSISRGL
jgi:hypothetical protein